MLCSMIAENLRLRRWNLFCRPAHPKPRNIFCVLNYYQDHPDGVPQAPAYLGKSTVDDLEPLKIRCKISDIRVSEDKFSLDVQGFRTLHHPTAQKDFNDVSELKSVYYPECEDLVMNLTKASRVIACDHTIRSQAIDFDPAAEKPGRGPVQFVHVDQSYMDAIDSVKFYCPDEAEVLLKHRFQIINVWRPIRPILRAPLALCDSSSVSDDDFITFKLIQTDRETETFGVRPATKKGGHKWWYLNEQGVDEVLVFKNYDSMVKKGLARRVPHTSLADEEREDEEARQSIEVRCLVFY